MILDAEKLGKDHSKTESGQSACDNWFSQASSSYGEVIDLFRSLSYYSQSYDNQGLVI